MDKVDIELSWYQAGEPRKETGYNFSRYVNSYRWQAGKNEFIIGANEIAEGDGFRVAVNSSLQIYPNAGFDQQTSIANTVVVGDSIEIPYFHATHSYGQTITFSLDEDTNPFNQGGIYIGSTFQNGRADGTIRATKFQWTPTTANIGTHYIRVMAANGAKPERYDYYFKPITVLPAANPRPVITSVSPPSVPTLPIPDPKRITILGSGFTASSILSFFDGQNFIASDPSRLFFISPTELKYDLRVAAQAGTWRVKVINGSVESGLWPFIVNAAADTTAPTAPSGLPASVWTSDGQFPLDWTNPNDASGIVKAWVKVGSVPTSSADGVAYPLPANKPLRLTLPVSEGSRSVHLWLEDGAGNRNHNNRATTTVGVDTAAPVVQITSPAANPPPTVQSTLVLTGSYSDNLSGVATLKWRNFSSGTSGDATMTGTSLSGSWSTPSITLTPGVNVIGITSTDAAGNVGAASLQSTYANVSNSGTVAVSIAPQEAVSQGAQWRVNAGEWRNSGYVELNIATGPRFIDFKNIPGGFRTPAGFPISVTAGQNISTNVAYTPVFVAESPSTPSNPSPAHGAPNVGRVQPRFTWAGGAQSGEVEFLFCFDPANPTSSDPAPYGSWGSAQLFQYPATLLSATTYNWRVKTRANGIVVDGPLWRFTTEYAVADLVASGLAASGNIEPGAQVTLSVTVKNEGSFISPGAYVHFYLSRFPGGKEIRLTPNVPDIVPGLQPGQQQTVTFTADLKGLPAGQSFIDAWIDSGPAGAFNESNFANNIQSIQLNYIDGKDPQVTYAGLANSFVKTSVSNSIIYTAIDDVVVKTMDFYYSTNSGLNWNVIQEGYVPVVPPTYGASYPWLIPANFPTGANLTVRAVARDTSGNWGEAISRPYLIHDGTAPTVRIVSPNGGEFLGMGSQQQIRWSVSAPNGIGAMQLWFYRNGTLDRIADITAVTSGVYVWTLPTPFATTDGKIQITVDDLNGNHAEDFSDAFFTVRDTSQPPPAPWIDPVTATSTSGGGPGAGFAKIVADAAGTLHLIYGLNHDSVSKTVMFRYKKRVNGAWTQPNLVTLNMSGTDNLLGGNYSVNSWRFTVNSAGEPRLVWATGFNSLSEWNKSDIYYTELNGSNWSVPQNLSQSILGGYTTTVLAWQSKASCPSSQVQESAVANNKLYVIANGGATYEYDPFLDQWATKASAPSGSPSGGGAVTVNGLIYVLGDNSGAIKIYHPTADSWSLGATIPTKRSGMCIATVSGQVFAIGGANSTKVEMYNPSSDSWTSKSDMPTARQYAAATGLNGKIYVFGGQTIGGNQAGPNINVYDTALDTWTTIEAPVAENWPTKSLSVAVTLNNRIYLMGGRTGIYTSSVDEFDPTSNSWQPMNSMQSARGIAVAGVIQSKIIIVGGFDGSSYIGSTEVAAVTGSVSGALSGSPAIAIDAYDKLTVVWQDGAYYQPDNSSVMGYSYTGQADIYSVSKPSGQGWSSINRVTTTGASAPVVAVGGMDKLHLTYFSGRSIGYRQWDGTAWSSESIAVSNSTLYFDSPSIAASTNNQVHLTWKSYDASAGRQQVFYSYFNGNAWLAKELVSMFGSAAYPTIGVDTLNRPHVTWEDVGYPYKLYYSRKSAGAWSPLIQLNRDAQIVSNGSSSAAIALASSELHVVWNSTTNGNSEVFYNHANIGATNDIYPPNVSVTAPITGSILSVGSTLDIRWTVVDDTGVATVNIDYSTNNGSSWRPIATNQANSGRFAWPVINLGTNAGQIRVTASDAVGNIGVGFSGNFTTADVTPPVISNPASVQPALLTGGSTANINWTATDNVGVVRIDLDYSLDTGATWRVLATNQANTGTYPWLVPSVQTSTLLLRTTAQDAAGLSGAATSQPISILRANAPPLAPSSPFPPDGSSFVLTQLPSFRWNSSDPDGDALTYHVRFGANTTPPLVLTTTTASFNPPALRPQRTYYWQVLASDGKATNSGPIWSFTTEAGPLPPTSLAEFKRQANGHFEFRFNGLFGETQLVQASTNLSDWFTVATFSSSNTASTFLDSAATNMHRRFYRVIVP